MEAADEAVAEDLAAAVGGGDCGFRKKSSARGNRSANGYWSLEMENSHMRQMNLYFDRSFWASFSKVVGVAIIAAVCFPVRALPQQRGQKTFSSPQDAGNAFFAAVQSNDEKAMLDILGPEGKKIVSSGDETADADSRANFEHKYQEMHRFVKEPDGTTTLYIGAENWPTPIPLMNSGNSWYFDTEAGKQEILYRRIGENEISTIRVCQELVAAEKEYRSIHHDEYAAKILSDEGQQNGLYWKTAAGELQSPIGPLVASAVADDHAVSGAAAPTPYRGYYFRMVTRDGTHGPGAAKSYVVNGKMTGGFAFVAYPAEYKSSGVMTFIVNEDGEVYQRDLGKKTAVLAKLMRAYNPDSDWQKAEDKAE